MTIRAIGVSTFGGPDVLHGVQLPEPHAGPREVRIQVHAAGVNPVDAMMRTGLLAALYEGVEPPYVAGMEIAGTIDELGDDVDPIFGLGLPVVGFVDFHAGQGGYSDTVVLPAASVTRSPDGLSDAEAASFLNNSLTARNTLDGFALPAGSTLLVTGAAGAVGGYLTQLGAADGLHVVGVAASADEELVRGFGAAGFVPRGDGFAAAIRRIWPVGVDAVADAAAVGDPVVDAVRDGGQIGALRARAGEPGRGITVHRLNVRRRATDHAAIAALRDQVEAGVLTARVAEIFPATKAVDAHRLLDKGGPARADRAGHDRMSTWTPDQAALIGEAAEIRIATVRADGTLRDPVPIWVVRVGGDLLVRSYRGPSGSWYRQATARPCGQITVAGSDFPVDLTPDQTTPAEVIDRAYAAKYGRGGYVAAMTTPAAAATTLRLQPTAAADESK